MIPLAKDGGLVFESIIVVTDRRILDRQIRDTIKQYAQVGSTVGHAEDSGDLRKFIEQGKKIVISTIQKFPHILDEIGNAHRDRTFAIIIDEAHSSQGGKTAGAMATALGEAGGAGGEEEEQATCEDRINRLIESRKMLPNTSYFAFTATPKNKTLEIFGEPDPQSGGTVRHLPFHTYSMKQAIQEGFILDRCVAVYMADLDEDGQVRFKSKAKAFVRAYAFLSSILPYSNRGWEERSIFLNFLIPKLPLPVEDDLSKGILETIDMDSYRVEKRAMRKIILEDEDGEIDPVRTGGGGGKGEIEIDRLSAIIEEFNDLFGGIEWKDGDRVRRMVTVDIPAMVAEDAAFKNARENSDRENARVEADNALQRAVLGIMNDDTQLFKQFADNPDFKRWLGRTVFGLVYEQAG